jgi:hypothetical protein
MLSLFFADAVGLLFVAGVCESGREREREGKGKEGSFVRKGDAKQRCYKTSGVDKYNLHLQCENKYTRSSFI